MDNESRFLITELISVKLQQNPAGLGPFELIDLILPEARCFTRAQISTVILELHMQGRIFACHQGPHLLYQQAAA